MFSIWATTVGNGPFRPALQINSSIYVLRQELSTEPQAYAVALQIVKTIEKQAEQTIACAQFVNSESKLANRGSYGMGRVNQPGTYQPNSALYEGGKP